MTGTDEERKLSRQVNDRLVELTGKDLDMKKVHVVFVFDEARKIVESRNFDALRRAMRVLPDGKGPLNPNLDPNLGPTPNPSLILGLLNP